MNRFFAKSENIFSDHIVIDGLDVNHIKNVLRMKKDDELMVSGGNNTDYLCSIKEFTDDEIYLSIISANEADRELPCRIHLFQGLPKGDKMEMIIQKCVELGVNEIIPVAMKRSVVRLDDKKARSKVARWQLISESAAKQSGRTIIPCIHEVMSFKEAVNYAKDMDVKLIPYELCEGMKATKEALSGLKSGMDVAVFIGPEGGLEVEEVEKAKELGIIPISLGKRILRTETAGLAIMAIIMYHLESGE